MRGMSRLGLVAALAGGLAVTLFVLAPQARVIDVDAQQSATSLGVDVNPEGNSATALGTRDVCLAVRSGDTFDIDLTVEGVTSPLIAWESYLGFDPNIVQVVDRDVQQLLASIPVSNVIDASESVPDDDGAYRIGASDISDPPVGAGGTGVLARLTLKAQAAGTTELSLSPIPTDANRPVGPFLREVEGTLIGDGDEDGLFDGPYLGAQVTVDQNCPGDGGVTLTDIAGDDGVSMWIFIIIAIGIVAAAAGLGGAALIILRRSGSHPAS